MNDRDRELINDLCATWEALGGVFSQLNEAIHALVDPLLEDFRELLESVIGEYSVVSGRNKPPNKYKDIPLHKRGKDNVYVTQRYNEKIRRGFPYWRRPY